MSATQAGISILVVDSDDSVAEQTAAALARELDSATVTVETDAQAGLAHLAGENVDCVVAEYDLPEMDGIELLERVRDVDGRVPFVLFTDDGSEAVASDAISAGVTDYLQRDGTGQYALLANRIRNAVERYRTRQQLQERQRRLETLISNLPGMVYRCRNDPAWPMEYVDGEAKTLTGYEASELTDGPIDYGSEVVHPADRDEVWEAVQQALEAGEKFETTYRIVTRSETEKWVWERGRGVYDEAGELEALEGFITDVTARKAREKRLEEQNARIQTLHDVATEIETCDRTDAIYDVVVEEARSVFDCDGTVATASTDDSLVPIAESPSLNPDPTIAIDSESRLSAQVYRTDEPAILDDAAERDLMPAVDGYRSALAVPIGDYGVFQAVAAEPDAFDAEDRELAELLVAHAREGLARIERETALREQTEQLARKNERLDEFTTIVSHDLRNLLDISKGRLGFVTEECDSEHLAVVVSTLDRMERLLDDLLALARQGETAIEPEAVTLARAVEQSWDTTKTADATLVVDTDRVVRADESQLRQLLSNLFRNAIEHGGKAVTVTVGSLEDGFYVADDGSGIPPEKREYVFDAGYTTARDGTGFGLLIVERVAQAHGWSVAVTDSRDGGARFEFTDVKSP